MNTAMDIANDLAGAAALVNGLILWPIVRSLQRAVVELKSDRTGRNRGVRTRRPGARRSR